MAAPAAQPEEEAALRRTIAGIAAKCRDKHAKAEDHGDCWRSLAASGFTDLRSDVDGEPAATVAQCAIVVEELARSVCGAPLLSTLLARELLRLTGVPEGTVADQALTVLLTPDLTTLAGVESGIAWGAAPTTERAVGRRGEELVLLWLAAPQPTQDLSRPAARPTGEIASLGVELTDEASTAFAAFARVLLAADMLGASSAVFESALDYAKQRVQFGRQIGAFQAVQHLCAKAYVQLEALRSTILFASWALDVNQDPRGASLVAKAYAGRATVAVAETATQVFGGVAITWEFPAHRHLRRTLLDAATLGSPAQLSALLLEETVSDGLH
jgi:alkylation response protein AidB-like acyl-CoA dehydrogenase